MPQSPRYILDDRSNQSITSLSPSPSQPQPSMPLQRGPRPSRAQPTPSSVAMGISQPQSQPSFAPPPSSSSHQTPTHHPPIEPGSNPNLPPHFTLVSVWTWTDYHDPECYIYNTIEDQPDHIILNARPDLGSCVIHLGTIIRKPGDEDYDPILHPKVLAVEMNRQAIHRWGKWKRR